MEVRHRILGVMVTMTTCGTWLRGDERGWVDEGRTFPARPELEAADRRRLKHDPFMFELPQLREVGSMIGNSLIGRLQQRIRALTVQAWHVHFVVDSSPTPIADVVRIAKEAVRYGLRAGRPIWTDGYDKRFCCDTGTLLNRIGYVERHNVAQGLPAKPWPFIS